jgi:hypothetical protein
VAAAAAMARWARRRGRCGAAAELPAARRGKASAGEGMAAVDGETEEGAAAVAFIGRARLGFVHWTGILDVRTKSGHATSIRE